jgi:hypothetical protein
MSDGHGRRPDRGVMQLFGPWTATEGPWQPMKIKDRTLTGNSAWLNSSRCSRSIKITSTWCNKPLDINHKAKHHVREDERTVTTNVDARWSTGHGVG